MGKELRANKGSDASCGRDLCVVNEAQFEKIWQAVLDSTGNGESLGRLGFNNYKVVFNAFSFGLNDAKPQRQATETLSRKRSLSRRTRSALALTLLKSIDFREVLSALVVLCPGSRKEKLSLCFKIFDTDESDSLDKEELGDFMWAVYTAFLDSSTVDERLHEVESFVHIAFSRGGNARQSLTFSGFCEICVIQPLIFRYLSHRSGSQGKKKRHSMEQAFASIGRTESPTNTVSDIHPLLRSHAFVQKVIAGDIDVGQGNEFGDHMKSCSNLCAEVIELRRQVAKLKEELKLQTENAKANRVLLDDVLKRE